MTLVALACLLAVWSLTLFLVVGVLCRAARVADAANMTDASALLPAPAARRG